MTCSVSLMMLDSKTIWPFRYLRSRSGYVLLGLLLFIMGQGGCHPSSRVSEEASSANKSEPAPRRQQADNDSESDEIISEESARKRKKTRRRMARLRDALAAYRSDIGEYPDELKHLINLPEKYRSSWNGPYLNNIWDDAWGRSFQYEPANGGFKLTSYGADGVPGGTGPDRDLTISN